MIQLPVLQPKEIQPIVIARPAEAPPEPKFYVVVYGDELENIAQAQNTTVERLFNANPDIEHPDQITVGQSLKIPLEDEELAPRPYPAIIESIASPAISDERSGVFVSRGSSSGNTYTPGQCTWGVKNWRPDIPNGWGSASQWLSRARSAGWSTGSTPRVGAVGWTSGHVVLVIGVNGDTVTIKEMNYNYVPYSVRTVQRPASKYVYIY